MERYPEIDKYRKQLSKDPGLMNLLQRWASWEIDGWKFNQAEEIKHRCQVILGQNRWMKLENHITKLKQERLIGLLHRWANLEFEGWKFKDVEDLKSPKLMMLGNTMWQKLEDDIENGRFANPGGKPR